MLDFSIDPVHFYLERYGKSYKHTEDFNIINRLTLDHSEKSVEVFLWSDTLATYVNVTDDFATINRKLGY